MPLGIIRVRVRGSGKNLKLQLNSLETSDKRRMYSNTSIRYRSIKLGMAVIKKSFLSNNTFDVKKL